MNSTPAASKVPQSAELIIFAARVGPGVPHYNLIMA
jgi:hypothetical protein